MGKWWWLRKVHVLMRVTIFASMYVHVSHVCVCVCMYVCNFFGILVGAWVCIHVCMYVYIYIYIRVYTYIHVYICEVHLYVDILRGMISADTGLIHVCVCACM